MRISAISALILAGFALFGCSEGNKGFVRPLTSSGSTRELTNEWEQWNKRLSEPAKRAAELDERVWGNQGVAREEWCSQVPGRQFYGRCFWKHFFSAGPSDNSDRGVSQNNSVEGGG